MRFLLVDNAIDHGMYRPLEHWAALAGFEPERVHPPGGDPWPRPGEHTHVLLSGSESSITAREAWAEEELRWVQRAARCGARILGSCWGHQLIAVALGGPDCVRCSPTPEFGWERIEPVARRGGGGPDAPDALIVETFEAFVSHFDEVVPGCRPELRVLATSPGCPVQALRWGDLPVWGIQAHPEIDPPTGRSFLEVAMERWPDHAARFRAALEGPVRDSHCGRTLLARFLAT
jgi:GMP synthase-like glutamine amidotransferase